MRFLEDVRNAVGEGAVLQHGAQIQLAHLGGIFAGKPVFGLAEQVVAHFSPRDQIERLGVSPEPQDFRDVDVAGNVQIIRQTVRPVRAPVRAENLFHFRAQPFFHGRNRLREGVVKF